MYVPVLVWNSFHRQGVIYDINVRQLLLFLTLQYVHTSCCVQGQCMTSMQTVAIVPCLVVCTWIMLCISCVFLKLMLHIINIKIRPSKKTSRSYESTSSEQYSCSGIMQKNKTKQNIQKQKTTKDFISSVCSSIFLKIFGFTSV